MQYTCVYLRFQIHKFINIFNAFNKDIFCILVQCIYCHIQYIHFPFLNLLLFFKKMDCLYCILYLKKSYTYLLKICPKKFYFTGIVTKLDLTKCLHNRYENTNKKVKEQGYYINLCEAY